MIDVSERDREVAAHARISPTAHYTGYTWLAHGLSHPAFATSTGRLLYTALVPANRALAFAHQPNLDGMLLARHRLIDALLEEAIAAGEIGQVIEVACGLSPRGHRFTATHGDRLTYVEADLPAMAARKREVLARAGGASAHHRVVEIDALADDGPRSLGAIAATLDPTRGTAIITEGLVNYFPRDAVTAMWARFARALARFPHGRYLSDLHLGGANGRFERVFAGLLGAFVRGRIHFHFDGEADALDALDAAGFDDAQLRRPEEHEELTGPVDAASARFVRILDASIRPTVGEAAAGL
ncbi:MAG TPA: class I SAM-dependent methyltransferase [Kofleriaceae bacterium]|nr:class I SAM-dependent methyltransferase [Kofleriaceae bacterium]